MRILLVDDENKSAAYLRKGLTENGFAVDVAQQAEKGVDLVRKAEYDLMVLHSTHGWPVFSELRRSGKHTPVLLLTSGGIPAPRGNQKSEPGVLKSPFAFTEFLSGVRSALGWGNGLERERFRVADLELDLMRQRATRAGRRLDLTPKEFLLLSLLVRRAGEVLSRAFIADQVWGINFDSTTNFVDVHIRRLRSKLDDPFPTRLIHTVRGRGYVLEQRP